MAKIFKRIIDIIFITVIIVLALYFILRFIGKIEICEVETGSMEDGIHAGDYVLIHQKNNYEIGDVITYKKDGYYVTHRIVKKKEEEIVTKGDANNTEDDAINVSTIVGKVILVGGILNIIIKFKFAIAAMFLSLYLISCYIGKDEPSEKEETNLPKDEDRSQEEIQIKKNIQTTATTKRVKRNKKTTSRKRLKKRIRVEYRKNK